MAGLFEILTLIDSPLAPERIRWGQSLGPANPTAEAISIQARPLLNSVRSTFFPDWTNGIRLLELKQG